jgi:hypothetical protein
MGRASAARTAAKLPAIVNTDSSWRVRLPRRLAAVWALRPAQMAWRINRLPCRALCVRRLTSSPRIDEQRSLISGNVSR